MVLASEAGLIERSGAHYAWNGERIAQGRDKACQYLGEHPRPLADELREKLVAFRKAENARLGHRFQLAVERTRRRSFGDRSNLGKLGHGPSNIP